MNLDFHFGNDETHECFIWLIEHRESWVVQKLNRAFELAQNDSDTIAISTSHSVREHLATLLEEKLEEVDRGLEWIDVDVRGTSLVENLLKLACNRIIFEVVAEAVMRHHQKWFPDRDRPIISE